MKNTLTRLGLSLVTLALIAPAAARADRRTPASRPAVPSREDGDVRRERVGQERLRLLRGTLGFARAPDGSLYILSNNHVLGRSGVARSGEDTLQPGLIDSNCASSANNVVGDYAGDVVPLGTGNVDAAISAARSNVDSTGYILDVACPARASRHPTIGLPVMKSGRTTGQTHAPSRPSTSP